jgi:hypothetical protein
MEKAKEKSVSQSTTEYEHGVSQRKARNEREGGEKNFIQLLSKTYISSFPVKQPCMYFTPLNSVLRFLLITILFFTECSFEKA